MHELSVCQALLAEVATIAARHGATGVERITIEVGRLSGVEPELLARAFDIARAGGCAARALLSIDLVDVTVRCTDCGAESQVRPDRLLCAACGGYRTRLLAGDALRLRAVELRLPERDPLPA